MRCFFHPTAEAVGVCVSCGKAICQECLKTVDDRGYCPPCFETGPFDWFDFRFGFRDFGRAFKDLFFTLDRCPKCKRSVRPDFRFCPHCQTPLRENCPNCNRPLKPDWVACPYCGQRR